MTSFTIGVGLSLSERRHYRITDKPEPIVDHPLIAEVAERVDWKGAVLVPLDEEEARRAISSLLSHGAESFAVCLLWSFKNPAHEQRLKELLAEMAPGAHVSCSADLSPLIGEYERSATTVLNAYVPGGPPGAPRRDRHGRRWNHLQPAPGLVNGIQTTCDR